MAETITNDAPSYIVQNVGAATISYSYPLELVGPGENNTLEADQSVSLVGFKLNQTYLDTNQAIDNSFIIPLLNGGSIQLTNNNTCGSMTVTAIRTSTQLTSGDIISIAQAQRAVAGGDSTGATITVTWSFNGQKYTIVFYNCTVAQCKALTMAGNDAPEYGVIFNFSHWEFV